MRRNYPRGVRRDPVENYDVIYEAMPDRPDVSKIIDHPRKLVIINLMADAWMATPMEISWERTCYDDLEED